MTPQALPSFDQASIRSWARAALAAAILLSTLVAGDVAALPRLVPGEIDAFGSFVPGEWVEMRDDGVAPDGVAHDGVFTARVTFPPSATPRDLGYLIVPPGADSLEEAMGVQSADGEPLGPMLVRVPSSASSFTLEVRYSDTAPAGFGPIPSFSDSWNTGFSLEPSLRRGVSSVIAGSFQDLLGTEPWDWSSEVTVLRDDGAFGDRRADDGVATFSFVSPVGVDRGSPGTWRVATSSVAGADEPLLLGADGWSMGLGSGQDFVVEAPRWMPVRFEVDLLRGMAKVSDASGLLDLPMISQMSPSASQGTYVDVMNTAEAVLALEGVYLADDRDYFRLSDPPLQISRGYDFNVAFPKGAWIAPSRARTVTVIHDLEEFESVHGAPPDYVVVTEPTQPHHMRLAYPMSVRTTLRGLTDSGEYVVLYSWAEGTALVEDLDAVAWGSDTNPLPLKTAVVIDGQEYGGDAGTINSLRAPSITTGSPALWRKDFRRAGLQRFFVCEAPCLLGDGSGYNGVFHVGLGGRFDATDQDQREASGAIYRGPASPGEVTRLSLAGMVVDEDGLPLAGVEIRASRGSKSHAAATGSDGSFFIEAPHGTWRVSIGRLGFSTEHLEVRLDHHKTLPASVALQSTGVTWTLSGVVTTSDGAPIDGASVTASPGATSVETNELGEYVLELAEGQYTILVAAPGFEPFERGVTMDRDVVLGFSLDEEIPLLQLEVAGRIERAGAGSPVMGALVELHDEAQLVAAGITSVEGMFELSGVRNRATYLLAVSAPGYEPYSGELVVGDDDVLDLVVELTPSAEGLSLAGTVLDGPTGAGIEDARVEVRTVEETLATLTDVQGRYLVTGIVPGEHDVSVSAEGFRSVSEPVLLLDHAERDFQLWPARRVTGVVSLEGVPDDLWEGTLVKAFGPVEAEALTGSGGSYLIGELVPGTYTLMAMRDGFVPLRRTVDLRVAGEEVDFVLQAFPEIDDSGVPHLLLGEMDDAGGFYIDHVVEMLDDGSMGDGLADDGVFTALVSLPESPSPRRLGYLVLPPFVTSMDGAVGMVDGDSRPPAAVPVTLPAMESSIALEVRYAPVAPEGFGPEPSIADSWNTGFSLAPNRRRDDARLVIAGSFQWLLGTAPWDSSSDVTELRDDGAYWDLEPGDGVASFAFVSPVGIEPGSAGTWRVAVKTESPELTSFALGAGGWFDGALGEDFAVEMPRWMPALFEVDLLRGMARVSEAPKLLELPMISQMSARASQGTYIDVMNTADAVLALEGIYLADDRQYHMLPLPPSQVSRHQDFNVAFPAGAYIGPSQSRTVTVTQDVSGFEEIHGARPDYVVVTDPVEPYHMRLAYPKSVTSTQRGLTDAGEYVVLYSWREGMALVEDLDAVVWGNDLHLLPIKTDASIDGAIYGDDLGEINRLRAPAFSTGSMVLWRQDFRRAGLQRLFECEAPCLLGDGSGFNGVFHAGAGGRFDMTDQDLTSEAGRVYRASPEPGSIAALSLSGTVTDEQNAPLSGVTVTARRGEETASTTSGEGGSFSLELQHGTWTLKATSLGRATVRRRVRVDHHKTLSDYIVMSASDATWTVTGAVTDAESGAAVIDATVRATPGGESTTTFAGGVYSLELPEGVHSLTVSAPGYRPETRDLLLDRDLFADFELQTESDPVRVRGRVIRADDGEAVPEAIVRLDDRGGTVLTELSGEDGSFELTDVPSERRYFLSVEAAGFATYQADLHVGDHDLDDVVVSLSLGVETFSLSGIVSRAGDDSPVALAAVELEMPTGLIRSVATDSEGRYQVAGLAPGSYELTASAPGFESRSTTLFLLEDTEVDFNLSPLALERSTITGTVSLAGQPESSWAGSVVTARGPADRNVLTQADGRYEIADLPSGSYMVTAGREGYVTATRSVELTSDTSLDFLLEPVEEEQDDEQGCGCSSGSAGSGLPSITLLFLGLALMRRWR